MLCQNDHEDDFGDDLRLGFETDEAEQGQLAVVKNTPGDDSTRELITEKEIQDTYFSARFDTVQYGTCGGRPACLLIITFNFHASNPKLRRFRRASIEVKFSTPSLKPKGKPLPVEILAYAPQIAYGMLSFSKVTSKMDLSIPVTIGNSLASAAITPSISRTSESLQGQRLVMQGSERGHPPSRIVWSIVENDQHPDGVAGIPSKVRAALIVGLKEVNCRFVGEFRVDASVGWTVDPRRWPLSSKRDDPVLFDTSRPLLRGYKELGPVFDGVDLGALIELGEVRRDVVAVPSDI
ncbi:hypothetical protein BV22DRAFT_1022714 [Leucogyrophana mollusca]|uniref:Uncharacterized protein n=1 Tax=Leucogyrophana mollusca TaxID=85980 RepID=A0ACB8B231_9AGAM|nr:hypothetical protein BV22DRAFT_1022714 [Leucogyrophana mollusca]